MKHFYTFGNLWTINILVTSEGSKFGAKTNGGCHLLQIAAGFHRHPKKFCSRPDGSITLEFKSVDHHVFVSLINNNHLRE